MSDIFILAMISVSIGLTSFATGYVVAKETRKAEIVEWQDISLKCMNGYGKCMNQCFGGAK